MARAKTLTKLPLDRWAEIMGLHPLHFNQIFFGELTLCGQPWMQYEWQAVDRVGREAVARAIAQAENDLERFLGYRLIPTWEVDERRPTVRPYKKELVRRGTRDLRGYEQPVFSAWGHLISGGIEQKTLIQADAAITYSDEDGDTYEETATVTVAVGAAVQPCEVAVYYPGEDGDAAWEIRPIRVEIAGGSATITFRRDQALIPDHTEAVVVEPLGVDGAVDAEFLIEVDVYRHWNDPSQQATLLWEPIAGGCGCGTTGCESCAYNAQTACLMPRQDPALGIFGYEPAEWDATAEEFTSQSLAVLRQPDIVRLYYYAGYQDTHLTCPRTEMADWLAQAVSYYAASLLDRPVCECNNVHAFIERWREDLATEKEGLRYKISSEDLACPFGTKRGAIRAWHLVRQQARNTSAVLA